MLRNWSGDETRAWRYRQGYPDKIHLNILLALMLGATP
jgi:hypothetical protein